MTKLKHGQLRAWMQMDGHWMSSDREDTSLFCRIISDFIKLYYSCSEDDCFNENADEKRSSAVVVTHNQ